MIIYIYIDSQPREHRTRRINVGSERAFCYNFGYLAEVSQRRFMDMFFCYHNNFNTDFSVLCQVQRLKLQTKAIIKCLNYLIFKDFNYFYNMCIMYADPFIMRNVNISTSVTTYFVLQYI